MVYKTPEKTINQSAHCDTDWTACIACILKLTSQLATTKQEMHFNKLIIIRVVIRLITQAEQRMFIILSTAASASPASQPFSFSLLCFTSVCSPPQLCSSDLKPFSLGCSAPDFPLYLLRLLVHTLGPQVSHSPSADLQSQQLIRSIVIIHLHYSSIAVPYICNSIKLI